MFKLSLTCFLDKMTDKKFLYAVIRMSDDEKESLMISEKERRRTFKVHWPVESIVKGNDCAEEGFYYTGVADRIKCAFCGGVMRNFERGDVPRFMHKNYFNYCKFVQSKYFFLFGQDNFTLNKFCMAFLDLNLLSK